MNDVCFSGASLTLLGMLGALLQAVVVTLFWLAIRSKDDAIKDARALRDRALDLNEQVLKTSETGITVVQRALPLRERR